MKKRLFFLVALMAAFMSVNAATDRLVVTLQKGDETKVFYGEEALVEAMNEIKSQEGSHLITLSEGVFRGPNYWSTSGIFKEIKSLKVQGAGYNNGKSIYNDNSSNRVVGFEMSCDDDDEGLVLDGLYYEGILEIRGTFNKCTIKRCKINTLKILANSKNVTIEQCRIRDLYLGETYNKYDHENMVITNSAIEFIHHCQQSSNVRVDHCYVNCVFSSAQPNCTNCIIWEYQGSEGSICTNCLVQQPSNVILAGGEKIDFLSSSIFGWEKPCTLTEEQAAKYVDSNGTQVGIYGGIGFSEDPTNPKITSTDISREATYDEANDKYTLNVKFTVETQE